MSIRKRLESTLAGDPVEQPVYLVYDWFVKNRDIDWSHLFDLGLGQMNHVDVIEFERPHLDIVETEAIVNGQTRKDIRWITDIGELHEYYLDGWLQEYLIKSPEDYQIMAYALSDTTITPTDTYYDQSEAELGENGITVAHLGWTPYECRRTALQEIQIDYAGLERFSIDILQEQPELLELIELLNDQIVEAFKQILKTKAQHIKLWENVSIETMGPKIFRKYHMPIYRRIFEVLDGSDKKLQVHYDGKLRVIADDIHYMPLDGIDSLTGPPEGDITAADARSAWPDKFFWLHPNLGWFSLPENELVAKIKRVVEDAGPTRFCLMISEEVPPNWEISVPIVLHTLKNMNS
ncbi:MAG: hypothetical protein JXB48_13090 [Candidatus Latescibacteria bacterium]|nr:hypothetical protein [Candidatus Latescibacterota bacterium]